jgi:pSer/pThr/pTyr-binding forkhead associated (FHA) protein
MSARVKILTGARAGSELSFSGTPIVVGRHADADLRFDPHEDLEVSTRHAELTRVGTSWYIRDLGSRNGTLLNGQSVEASAPLQDGDVVQFGRGGPKVTISLQAVPKASTVPRTRTDTPAPGLRGATQLIRAEVASRTKRLRLLAGVLGLLLVAVTAFAILATRSQRELWRDEMAAMQAQIDQILTASARTEEDLQGRAQGLESALEESREQLRGLQTRLQRAEARDSQPDVTALRRELLAAQSALARRQLAPNIDYAAIERVARPAVARIFVEYASGQRFAATAFSVAETGRLVTNRHVVERESGETPGRIGVQFAGSVQVYPARLVAASEANDLALLQLERLAGEVPALREINARPDTLASGSPVVVLGFPLAGAPTHESAPSPEAVLSAGLLVASTTDFVEVEALGAEGSSGSPIFDLNGHLIGVLFGGRLVDGQERLVAASSTAVVALIEAVPNG